MSKKWTEHGARYIDYSKSDTVVNATKRTEVKTMIANEELLDKITTLAYLRGQRDNFKKLAEDLAEELRQVLGDSELIYDERETKVMSYYKSDKSTFDQKKFQEDHPVLFNQYKKTGIERCLRVCK